MTTNIKNFELKIAAIKSLGTDIIFLSDTRMVSNKGINGLMRVKQAFRDYKGKKYKVYANSSKNSRGVAILISFDIDIEITETCSDVEENYLFVRAKYKGQNMLLGSIYGPNSTSRDFYRCITRILNKNRDRKIIMGGDWNTVWDRNPIATNIDTFHMANIPNAKNSELLENMASEFGLFDPYRVMYPSKRSFTYSPYGRVRLNRSRLDFFVVSSNVLDDLAHCECSFAVTIKLFDHKSVTMVLGNPKLMHKPPPKLRNSNLTHPLVIHHVKAAEILCHAHSMKIEEVCNIRGPYNLIKMGVLNTVNSIKTLLDELHALYEGEAKNGPAFGTEREIQAKINEIEHTYNNMIPTAAIIMLKKNCTNSRFFEVLTEQTRNAGIKAQKMLAKLHKLRTSSLESKIEHLKKEFDQNYEQIFECENNLSVLKDTEVRDRLMDLKILKF
jgi:exonuclease III